MIALDDSHQGQTFILHEDFPGLGQIKAEVEFVRAEGPALLFRVVSSSAREQFPPGARIVRLKAHARRWRIFLEAMA